MPPAGPDAPDSGSSTGPANGPASTPDRGPASRSGDAASGRPANTPGSGAGAERPAYRTATADDASAVADLLREAWGETRAVGHGVVYELTQLPTLLAESDGQILGILTYQIEGEDLQIVSINAFTQHAGIGTGLVEAAKARAHGCRRLWLTTTNDNLDALRFYQRRGFRLIALRPGAVRLSRQLKPSIPLTGEYGIEISDELDLELPL